MQEARTKETTQKESSQIQEKYFYEIVRPGHNLHMRQYIYHIGRYRYNWHKALEILLVLRGPIEMSCGGENVLLEEGDFLLIDSNIGHASLSRREGSVAMVLQIEPEYLEEYFETPGAWKFGGHTDASTRNTGTAIEIRSLLCAMIGNLDHQSYKQKILLEQELNRLLFLLFELFPPVMQTEADKVRSDKSLDMLEKVVNYIEKHYREKMSLEDISNYCRYNPSYMSTFFKKHMGVTFYDYLTRVRLREATLELCATNDKIVDIAENNGFADVKAFNTAFRKTFGKSPREYRQQILKENRGKELMEKRTFLPVNDEYVNSKLEQFIRDLQTIRGSSDGLNGNIMFQEAQIRDLKEKTLSMYQKADEIRRQMEVVCSQMTEIQQLEI